jgi:hypothetical protein
MTPIILPLTPSGCSQQADKGVYMEIALYIYIYKRKKGAKGKWETICGKVNEFTLDCYCDWLDSAYDMI